MTQTFEGTGAEFIKFVNKKRLDNKGKWFFIVATVDGKHVAVKGFNTWLQRCTIDGVEHGNCGDQTATEFKEYLNKTFS